MEEERDAGERVSVSEESGGEGPEEGNGIEALKQTAHTVGPDSGLPHVRQRVRLGIRSHQ